MSGYFITSLQIILSKTKDSRSNQSGNGKQHSTKRLGTAVTDYILEAMGKKITAMVLPDFTKAFDSINHSFLLNKLQRFGVSSDRMPYVGLQSPVYTKSVLGTALLILGTRACKFGTTLQHFVVSNMRGPRAQTFWRAETIFGGGFGTPKTRHADPKLISHAH